MRIPRGMEEIQKEYNQVCNQAGDFQYRIKVMKNDLNQINQKLMELNHEAIDARKMIETSQKEVTSEI